MIGSTCCVPRAELGSYGEYHRVPKKKKNSPLDQIKMNDGTDAKKYSSHLTVIGYFSNLPRIIFKKSSESNTTEKYLRKFQVLVTFPSTPFSVKQNYDTN